MSKATENSQSVNRLDALETTAGAATIGASTASGLTGVTVQAQLNELAATWGTPVIASQTILPRRKYIVLATSAAVELTLGTFSIGSQFSVKNSADSTQTVRVLNPSYTFKGSEGEAVSPDTVTIAPGQTLIAVARTATILEV